MVLRKAGDHNICTVFEDDEDCVKDGRGRKKRERGVIQTLFFETVFLNLIQLNMVLNGLQLDFLLIAVKACF